MDDGGYTPVDPSDNSDADFAPDSGDEFIIRAGAKKTRRSGRLSNDKVTRKARVSKAPTKRREKEAGLASASPHVPIPSTSKTNTRSILRVNKHGKFELNGRCCDAPCCCGGGSYCAVEDYLGLVCLEDEGYFGCIRHKSFIPLSRGYHHVTVKHRDVVGRRFQENNPGFLEKAIEHLADNSRISRDQGIADVDVTRERSEPIDLLPDPDKCVQCPTCLRWLKLTTKSGLSYLKKTHCVNPKFPNRTCALPHPSTMLTERWAQYCFYEYEGVKSSRVPIRDGWHPAIRSLSPVHQATETIMYRLGSEPPPLSPYGPALLSLLENPGMVPQYARVLGWDRWFRDLGASAKDIQSLIVPPKGSRRSMCNKERHLEKRLASVAAFCQVYLQQANRYAEEANIQLRDALTIGSTNRTAYRNLGQGTIRTYSRSLFQPMALLLRFKLYFEIGKHRRLNLGKFVPSMTPKQLIARNSFYDFLMADDTDDGSDPMLLGEHFHRLADSLLKASIPVSVKIGGPSDFIIILSALLHTGQFDDDPNIATHACSEHQFSYRSIRLMGGWMSSKGTPHFELPFPDSDADADEHEEEEVDTFDDAGIPFLMHNGNYDSADSVQDNDTLPDFEDRPGDDDGGAFFGLEQLDDVSMEDEPERDVSMERDAEDEPINLLPVSETYDSLEVLGDPNPQYDLLR